jgi:hypothetical protein
MACLGSALHDVVRTTACLGSRFEGIHPTNAARRADREVMACLGSTLHAVVQTTACLGSRLEGLEFRTFRTANVRGTEGCFADTVRGT